MFFLKFGSWIILSFLFGGLDAELKTFSVEHLCFGLSNPVIDLDFNDNGRLTSVADVSSGSCRIQLKPRSPWSTVLSIRSYNLDHEEELIIEDSDNFKVKLLGQGFYPDERKSFESEGSIYIHYTWNRSNASRLQRDRFKFEFVFTRTSRYPQYCCEFRCKNERYIHKKLVCDSHNNCGDSSDEKDCSVIVPSYQPTVNIDSAREGSPSVDWRGILVVAAGVVIAIIIIVVAAVLFRRADRKKIESQNSLPTSTTVLASTIPNPGAGNSEPKLPFSGMANSEVAEATLRNQTSEHHQVLSMYPELPPPSASHQTHPSA